MTSCSLVYPMFKIMSLVVKVGTILVVLICIASIVLIDMHCQVYTLDKPSASLFCAVLGSLCRTTELSCSRRHASPRRYSRPTTSVTDGRHASPRPLRSTAFAQAAWLSGHARCDNRSTLSFWVFGSVLYSALRFKNVAPNLSSAYTFNVYRCVREL